MQMLIKIYPQNIGIMKTTSLMIGVYINKYIYIRKHWWLWGYKKNWKG